jgi:hypothetical protein
MPLYTPPARFGGDTQPIDSGFLVWNFDPAPAAGTGSSPMVTAGQANVERLYVDRPITVTNLHVMVQTAGATLTSGNCRAALYNAAGTSLSITADQSTSWNSTGFKTMALGAAQTLTVGFYDVALWYNGTTGPAFVRGTSYAFINGSLSGASLRSATANTGMTSTATALGTKTASIQNFWVALS